MRKKTLSLLVSLFVVSGLFAMVTFYTDNLKVKNVSADEYSDDKGDSYDEKDDKKDSYDEKDDKKDSYDEKDDKKDKKKDKKKDSYDSYDKGEDKNKIKAQGKTAYDEYDKKDAYDGYSNNKGVHDEYSSGNDSYDAYGNKRSGDAYDAYGEGDAYDGYGEAIITREIINNADGTTTKRLTKKEGTEVEVIEITYDSNGNKIMEKKMEREKNEEEFEVKLYDVYGKKVSEYELKTKNGAVVKVEYKERGVKGKVKFNVEKEEFSIEAKDGSKNKIKVKSNGDYFRISKSGVAAISSFPMKINEANGEISVVTAKGSVVLSAMPDVIVNNAKTRGDIDLINKVELQEENQLEYKVQGVDFQKLLGIFTVEVPTKLTYSAQDGSLLSKSSDGFFASILNILSL